MKIYKFDDCYLNPIERRVLKAGELVKLSSRAFDTLLLLVENCGDVVAKNDLIRKVWHGSFVEEGNIAVHISALRKALGESESKGFIETVTGTGYRFVARVTTVSETAWHECLSKSHQATEIKQSEDPLNSVAVLPFTNSSGNKEVEYLAEEIAENIVNRLCSDSRLIVFSGDKVSRFSKRSLTAQEVGRRLGVDLILTGRIRLVGHQQRIGVELTKVEDGSQLWGGQYDQEFSDTFSIQEEIVVSICQQLRLQIDRVSQRLTDYQGGIDPEVSKLYLKGKFFLSEKGVESLAKSVKYFQESIFLDRTHVPSYIGLINCYLILHRHGKLSLQKAFQLIRPLLEYLDRHGVEHPEIHSLKGEISLKLEWDWRGAADNFRRAIALDPDNIPARNQYAELLNVTGNFKEALDQLKYALDLNPLSISLNITLARTFYCSEQYDRAIRQLGDAREIDSSNTGLLSILSACLIEKGEYDEAVQILQTLWDENRSFEYLAMLGYAHGRRGRVHDARRVLAEMEQTPDSIYVDFYYKALVHSSIDETDLALMCLEESLKHRDCDIIILKVDPRLIPLRQQRKFHELIEKIGFQETEFVQFPPVPRGSEYFPSSRPTE
jgi:DNA-binding winged helix-turn-helix (wHTH) protein/tetratricopeptide (TPR) repeat protein